MALLDAVGSAKPFVLSLIHTLWYLKFFAIAWFALALWMSFELRFIGIWVAGSMNQTALAAISVHLLLTVADFDLYTPQQKPIYCESSTFWFRVEYLLSCMQVIFLYFTAPHWPLTLLAVIGFCFETYFCVAVSERRTLDPVTIWKMKKPIVKDIAWKVGVHGIMFLLHLMYIGPFIILGLDEDHHQAEAVGQGFS